MTTTLLPSPRTALVEFSTGELIEITTMLWDTHSDADIMTFYDIRDRRNMSVDDTGILYLHLADLESGKRTVGQVTFRKTRHDLILESCELDDDLCNGTIFCEIKELAQGFTGMPVETILMDGPLFRPLDALVP